MADGSISNPIVINDINDTNNENDKNDKQNDQQHQHQSNNENNANDEQNNQLGTAHNPILVEKGKWDYLDNFLDCV